jgi:hypothetical protein
MNELFQLVIILAGATLSAAAFFAALGVFFPKRIARARLAFEAAPGRSFMAGVVNFLFFGAIALVFASMNEGDGLPRLLAILVLTPPAIGMCLGLAALAQVTGEKLAPQTGSLRPAWGAATGAAILALGSALPVIGWFLLLPFLLLLGLGVFVVSLFTRGTTET